MYNFLEIKQKVAIIAQRSGDADYLTKIEDWINIAHNVIANSYDFWSALQAKPWRFSSVNGTENYYFPSDFDKPYRLFDLTNDKRLVWTTREEYYDANVSNISTANTGEPANAMLYGVSPIAYVPTSSFTLKAKSSSTADNTGIKVRIEGWLNSIKTISGYEDITISTSDPTTYATATSSITFYGITRVTKSADTAGYVTLADSSTNVLATIAPYDRESRYPTLYLGLIPDAAYTYELLYKKKIKKLVNDNDYPFMDCQDFLILHALGYAFHQEKESESRAELMWKKADETLALLMRNEQDKYGPNFQHKMVPLTNQSHRY